MFSRHIDAIALAVIALAIMVFSRPPEFRFVHAEASTFGMHDAVGRFNACPFTSVHIPRFR